MPMMKISPGNGFEEELEKFYWGRGFKLSFERVFKK